LYTLGWVGLAAAFDKRIFSEDAPVELTADVLNYNKKAETYYADGNVVIVQGNTILKADTAVVNIGSGTALATGNVSLVDEGGNILKSDNIRFNIEDKTAVVGRGRIFFKEGNVYITGEPIRKTGPESYETIKPTYTTCDCPEGETPPWQISASSAKVTIGQFLTGRNAVFRVKGVPVAYSPYFRAPINRKRQTGFLRPRLGQSRLRGFVMDNSLFWAISRNTDATFYLDFQGRRGLGKGAEFRYIRTPESYGQVYAYHFREDDIDRVREFREGEGNLSRPESADNNRVQFKLDHTENLPGGVRFKAGINVVSDDEYMLDFGRSAKDKSLESIESNISVSKSWSVYSLVGQLRVFDNLLLEDDDTTLKKLPELTFSASGTQFLKSPFYLSLASSLVNFERKTGTTGLRLDITPKLSLPLNPGGWFELTPSIAPRSTSYELKDNPGGDHIHRYLYEARSELTTTFTRIYRPRRESLTALKHTLRPKLIYSYIPNEDQTDLPGFDGVDNIIARNDLTYSLNSTLTGKLEEDAATSYFEYLYMDISQSYDLAEAKRDLTSAADRRRPFSDVTAELILRPAPWSKLAARGTYDTYKGRYNRHDSELTLSDLRGLNFHITHRFVRDTTRYLEIAAGLKLTATTDLTYTERFSFDEDKSLETSYGLVYKQQCWTAYLNYISRIEEKIVYLSFDLLGLGRVAGLSGKMTNY
jgi:LPS-assembly protein